MTTAIAIVMPPQHHLITTISPLAIATFCLTKCPPGARQARRPLFNHLICFVIVRALSKALNVSFCIIGSFSYVSWRWCTTALSGRVGVMLRILFSDPCVSYFLGVLANFKFMVQYLAFAFLTFRGDVARQPCRAESGSDKVKQSI